MALNGQNRGFADRESTPSGRVPPRCSICGEKMKGHNTDLCAMVGSFKDGVRGHSSAAGPVKQELGQEPSASLAGRVGFNVTRMHMPNDHQSTTRDKGFYLAASVLPNLTTCYSPIMEMRTLLELRGLRLTHFHINEEQEWAFVVTGKKANMTDWVTKSKVQMIAGQTIRPNVLWIVMLLIMGAVITAVTILTLA